MDETKFIIDTPDGEKLHYIEAAKRYNIKNNVLHKRLYRLGWDPIKSLTTPVKKYIRNMGHTDPLALPPGASARGSNVLKKLPADYTIVDRQRFNLMWLGNGRILRVIGGAKRRYMWASIMQEHKRELDRAYRTETHNGDLLICRTQ